MFKYPYVTSKDWFFMKLELLLEAQGTSAKYSPQLGSKHFVLCPHSAPRAIHSGYAVAQPHFAPRVYSDLRRASRKIDIRRIIIQI